MAEERKSWAAWFQRKIDARDENHGPVGFCWLDDPLPEDDNDNLDRRPTTTET